MTTPPSQDLSPKKKPNAVRAFGLLVVIAGLFFGTRYYQWSRTHVSTDDAYVTGNIVQLSPIVAGTVRTVLVSEGDQVQAGEVVAVLNDESQRAALRSAEAGLLVAKGQVPQAAAHETFERLINDAAIQKANSGLDSAINRVMVAKANHAASLADIETRIAVAQASLGSATVTVVQATSSQRVVTQQLDGAQASVVTAERSAESSAAQLATFSARIPSVETDLVRAETDQRRYETLLLKNAVTKQQVEIAQAATLRERANLNALKGQNAAALANLAMAKALVTEAKSRVLAASAAVSVSTTSVRSAEQAVAVAEAHVQNTRAARKRLEVDNATIRGAETGVLSSGADRRIALAGRVQESARMAALSSAKDAVSQAEGAVQTARENVAKTIIRAAFAGIVLKKSINVGASVVPGQTILTLTQGTALWVTANFKETQIGQLRLGQPVDVVVDALRGLTAEGVVASIGNATGATTALLPPDNASGNFTKVVQRVPVRIALTKKPAGLRMGLSTTTTVDIRQTQDHSENVPLDWNGKAQGTGK